MKTTHTQGSFTCINAEQVDEFVWECKVYVEINGTTLLHAKVFGATKKEAEANAKPIAAAPELLDKLKDVCESISVQIDSGNGQIEPIVVESYNEAIKTIN